MKKAIISFVVLVVILIVGLIIFYPEPQIPCDPGPCEDSLTQNETPMTEQPSFIPAAPVAPNPPAVNGSHLVTIKTSRGDIVFETYDHDAPLATQNFINLAEGKFYDGLIFHRVIDGFMIQGGDPEGTGRGGPGYTFADELDPTAESYKAGYKEGVVAMANRGPNTNGSQFFIMLEDYPLPNNYTIFGKVISGQEVVDAIGKVATGPGDRPMDDVVMESVIIEKK